MPETRGVANSWLPGGPRSRRGASGLPRCWIGLILFGWVFAAGAADDLPPGWRLPTPQETADEPLRQHSPSRYARVVADFNGDGVNDKALLLKSTQFSGEALWVRLSAPGRESRWIQLDEIRWPKEYTQINLARGIDVVAPGVHAYACFDTARECEWGDWTLRPKLRLKDPALLYFTFENAASMFFWSRTRQRFLRVWLSE